MASIPASAAEPVSAIMLQFLTWVADRPRRYADTMAAWRSTCPRLSVWEDAIIDGLVRVESGGDRGVTLTRRGRQLIANSGAPPAALDRPRTQVSGTPPRGGTSKTLRTKPTMP